MSQTIRVPFAYETKQVTEDTSVRAPVGIDLTPDHIAQILGDLPGRLAAVERAIAQRPLPAQAVSAVQPQQDAKPQMDTDAHFGKSISVYPPPQPTDGVDANDAPEGYVAVAGTDCYDCGKQDICGHQQATKMCHPCVAGKRKDGKSVIFVKRDAAKPDADEAACEAIVDDRGKVKFGPCCVGDVGCGDLSEYAELHGGRVVKLYTEGRIAALRRELEITEAALKSAGATGERFRQERDKALAELAAVTDKGRGFAEKCDRLEADLAAATERADRLENDYAKSLMQIRELTELAEKAEAVNDQDRQLLHRCVREIQKTIGGRRWLAQSRGPYEFDDPRYQQEFRDAIAAIDVALDPLLAASQVLDNCGPHPVACIAEQQRDAARADADAAKAKLRHVCDIMSTLGDPGLKDVLLEMHAYLFPEATAIRDKAALAAHDAKRGGT